MTHVSLARQVLHMAFWTFAAGRWGTQAGCSAGQSAERNVVTEASATVTECSELNARSVLIDHVI